MIVLLIASSSTSGTSTLPRTSIEALALLADPYLSPAEVIEHHKPLQLMAVEEAQEIASLIGRGGHIERVAGSEPNATRN